MLQLTPGDDRLAALTNASNGSAPLRPVLGVQLGPKDGFGTIRMTEQAYSIRLEGNTYSPSMRTSRFSFPSMGASNYRGLVEMALIGTPPNSNDSWWETFDGHSAGVPITILLAFVKDDNSLTQAFTMYKGWLAGKRLVQESEDAPAMVATWAGPLAQKQTSSIVIATANAQKARDANDTSHDLVGAPFDRLWGRD